jgi:hypothetical protein
MPIFSYLKVMFVFLLTVTSSFLFFILLVWGTVSCVWALGLPVTLLKIAIVFESFSMVLFGGAFFQHFANYLLYDKNDRAELQLVGGVKSDGLLQAKESGKGVPFFAKLSASQETLRLQTPFGNYAWERADPRLVIQKARLFPGQWKIGTEDATMTRSIIFGTQPWKAKMVERKLKELGYEVRPRTEGVAS